jgi:hypothetical protein
MKSFLLVSVAVALLSLSACGGGGSIGTPPPQTFTIGGTVSGLTAGTSVVLQNNGGNNLTVSANGSFTFSTPATSYNVTVLTQPTGLNCMVTDGTGTATASRLRCGSDFHDRRNRLWGVRERISSAKQRGR